MTHRLLQQAMWLCAGSLTLWAALSVFVLPSYATRVGANPVVSSPAELGMHFENVIVLSDELSLPGWWIPADEPIAELMFVHGAGSNRTSHFIDSLSLYRTLTAMGISVLTVDLRNHGNAPKSSGHLTMGLAEHRDVLAMAAWLDARATPHLPRLVMGASMGGATAIHALSNGLKVDGVILFDPALNTADSLAQGAWVNTGLPPALFKLFAWASVTFYSLPQGATDTLTLAQVVRQPILVIQDPDDPVTRLPYAQHLANTNDLVDLRIAAPVTPDHPCLFGKGRWGSHVAAFRCDNSWVRAALADYLNALNIAPSAPTAATSEYPSAS